MKIRPKSPEDLAREKIPTLADVPTLYRPCEDFLMVVPIPDVGSVGDIILPDRSIITYNEGHIVAKGPYVPPFWEIGDCVTWNPNSDYKFAADGVKFVLVKPTNLLMRIPVNELRPCPEGVCPVCRQEMDYCLCSPITAERILVTADKIMKRNREAPLAEDNVGIGKPVRCVYCGSIESSCTCPEEG